MLNIYCLSEEQFPPVETQHPLRRDLRASNKTSHLLQPVQESSTELPFPSAVVVTCSGQA